MSSTVGYKARISFRKSAVQVDFTADVNVLTSASSAEVNRKI